MLLAGLGGLGAEVAKNLILAGVKGLTLLDHEQVHCTIHTGVRFYLSSSEHTATHRQDFSFSLNLGIFVFSYQVDICLIVCP